MSDSLIQVQQQFIPQTWHFPLWIFFSVVLGLCQLVAVLIYRQLHRRAVNFRQMLKDGSLLFFAVPLATGACAELLITDRCANNFAAVVMTLSLLVLILFLAGMLFYAIIDVNSARNTRTSRPSLFIYSLWVAIFSVVYSVSVSAFRIMWS